MHRLRIFLVIPTYRGGKPDAMVFAVDAAKLGVWAADMVGEARQKGLVPTGTERDRDEILVASPVDANGRPDVRLGKRSNPDSTSRDGFVIRTLFPAMIALTGCILARAASAHHAYAMFDMAIEATVEGTVKEFAWTNPHVVLKVVANPKSGQPPVIWILETASPGNLTRMGWSKRSFNPGDRVKVVLHPLRSGEPGGSFARATLIDSGKEVVLNWDGDASK